MRFYLYLLTQKVLLAALLLVTLQAGAQSPATELKTTSAAPPAVSMVYLLDAAADKTVEQIEQMPRAAFAPFDSEKPVAIKNGTLWIRFAAITNTPEGLRLTLPMATVDDVTLFYRDSAGQWVTQYGGDTRPMRTWAQPGRYPSFVLSNENGRAVDYLLKVRHERGLFSTLPRIVTESAFVTLLQNEHFVLGMYFGLAALVVVLALSRALVYRDAGFGTYALYVALLALLIATVSGMSALYLWPEQPISTVMSPVLGSVTGMAACWFVRVVTRPKRFSILLDRALLTAIVLAPLGGLLTIVQPSGWGYTVYSTLVLLSTLVMLSVILGALCQGDHDSRWVALGFLPIIAAAFVPLLRNFGWIPASSFTEMVLPLASAIEVIILFYGLHSRVSQRRSVATRVTRLQQIDPLSGLHTRDVLTAKLAVVVAAARRKQEPYALVVFHLANAATLLRQNGQEAADRALVLAASCIRSAVQAGDTLARVGPAEFALLMESPVSLTTANGAATKVLAASLRNISDASDLPDGQMLRFQISVGYPHTAIGKTTSDTHALFTHMLTAATSDGSSKVIRLVEL